MATKFDPQLHILRSAARSLEDSRNSHEAETARFNVFTAIEQGKDQSVLDWLDALEVSFRRAYPPLDDRTQAAVERSISTIRSGLAEEGD